MHELREHGSGCFVTLTYSDEHLPPLGSLRYADIQTFHKRLRKVFGPFRFYVAGEYGERTQRAHWHACYFGLDFERGEPRGRSEAGEVCYDSPELAALWRLGFVTVGELTRQSAGYVARYVTKKLSGDVAREAYAVVDDDGCILGERVPPMARMSTCPGIGAKFVERFSDDLLVHGSVVLHGGVEVPLPEYYQRKLLKGEATRDRADELKAARAAFDARRAANSTPERLAVREEVFRAKVRRLKRGSL